MPPHIVDEARGETPECEERHMNIWLGLAVKFARTFAVHIVPTEGGEVELGRISIHSAERGWGSDESRSAQKDERIWSDWTLGRGASACRGPPSSAMLKVTR